MVDVYVETIDNSISVAKLLNMTVYLKGTNRIGWKLYDEPPDKPYFIIQADGQTVEIREGMENEN